MILNKMWLLDKPLSIQVLAGLAVMLLVVTAGILMRASTATGWMSVAAHGANDSPIACVLEALTGEKQKRRRVLVEHLLQRVKGVIELETGFVLQLQNDGPVRQIAEELIALEQQCCRFLDFDLQGGDDGDPITLSITGKEGVKEFLREELGLNKS